MAHNVTDEDRAAAERYGLWLLDDERDDLAEAFAVRRIVAFNAGLERAAVIAGDFDAPHVAEVAKRIIAAIRAGREISDGE